MITHPHICYLAGAMANVSFDAALSWRQNIKSQIEGVTDSRWQCFNPIDHFHYQMPNLKDYSEREIMDYELSRLRKSDLVICRWERVISTGTTCEVAIAHELGIPVLIWKDAATELHPWIESMALHVFTDEDDLMGYVANHFLYEE